MADVYKQSFKQNYTNNIELSIFNCGIERCAPGQTWGPGIRDHYLIHLVLSGKGVFEVGGRTWEVSQGQLFFARPSQLIRYTADEQQPWEYSWVGFNGACAHKLAAQLPFPTTRRCITPTTPMGCVPLWPTFIPPAGCSRRMKPPWWATFISSSLL